MAFWIGVIVAVLIVIGLTVLSAKLLSGPRRPRRDGARDERMMALKASGAFKHRKSNR